MIRYVAAAFVTTVLLFGPGSAGAETAQKSAQTATASHKAGEWRASKLVGVNVYNQANEKIGDISDVILDESGKVSRVVLGVGGFLGMGEHYVAVAYDKLKWMDQPVRTTTSDATTTRPANPDGTAKPAADDASRTTGSSTSARTANDTWYPDHVVYNATKDQLKDMPQFKY